MIACVDVDYRTTSVVTAVVGFDTWTDEHSALELVVESDAPPAAYEPGRFYLRELPHVLAALQLVTPPSLIVVDGYAWLGPDRKGLGAHLHDALGEALPVVGVAKNSFFGAQPIEVQRGTSRRPLYVTAAGIDVAEAAAHVRSMRGEFRIPTLLRRVDQLTKGR